MNEQEKLWLEYLLADYRAIKDEIARRSNLQKAVLAALVGFNAWLLNEFVAREIALLHIAALWTVTILSCIFHAREGFEIARLGSIIREKIAESAARVLKVDARVLLPSETDAGDPRTDGRTRMYDRIFRVSVFFIVPGAITVMYLIKFCIKRI